MRLLFDQNISYRILKKLPEAFEGSSHVKTEGLINASDFEIWEYARINNFIIVTLDSDFNDLYLLKGFPPKIIWFQTGNLITNELLIILNDQQNNFLEFLRNPELGCLELSRVRNIVK